MKRIKTILFRLLALVFMVLAETTISAQITPSTTGELHLYRIHNVKGYNNNDYYIGPKDGTGPLLCAYNDVSGTNNNTGDNFYWYFEYAGTDNGVVYYHIINYGLSSTKYVYCTNTNSGSGKIRLTANAPSSSLDAYCFRIEPSNNSTYPGYVICPYGSTLGWNPYNGVQNEKNIGLYTWSDDGNIWDFIPACNEPSITFSSGYVTMTGGTIYYTTDGSTPTTSSNLYSAPIPSSNIPLDATVIKAVCYCSDKTTYSDIVSYTIDRIPMPTIVYGTNQITVTSDVAEHIYYAIGGTASSSSSELPANGVISTSSNATISLYMTADGYFPTLYNLKLISSATDLGNITSSGYYLLVNDIDDASSFSTISSFSGTLDGGFHTIKGLTNPLFATADGATIRNVILDDVTISSGTNVGAIANTASGATRIYNCGVLDTTSAIGGIGNVGSIVGQISDNTRVVNCFSYADITSGNTVGGIVGNNNGTSVTTSTVFGTTGTLVMNCAFFGEIAPSCSNKYPVFGGNDIENVSGVNTYNYYIYDDAITYTGPNSSQGTTDTMFFNRFDFYRGLLNSHRDLAAMYIFGTQDVSDAQKNEVAHWLFDPETKEMTPYLQLEPWPTNTTSTLSRTIPSTEEAYHGKQVGSVSCTFVINGTSRTVTLPLTDMDTANWDYTYGKIVLPFANEFGGWSMPASGSTNYDNIITGWEVTSITGGTLGTYSNYNLCDPHHYAKDLYTNNNYVFAQGGNFIVPQGVTGITFTAHIVRCVYLRDAYPDIAYNGLYNAATNLGTQLTGTYNGKTVYTNLTNAYAQLQSKTNPADQAIVLVGNYHYNQAIESTIFPIATGTSLVSAKAATIMSVDADNNQDPDYCFLQYHSIGAGRTAMPPIRFDFVVSPGIGMASYTKAGYLPSIDIYHSEGWFETTETFTGIMTETEIRPYKMAAGSPWIINGGIYERIIMGTTAESQYTNAGLGNDNLAYVKMGGKAYVKTFYPGHKKAATNTLKYVLHIRPVNICGGEIEYCSLTGYESTGKTTNNAYLYANGGYIHEYTSAYQSKINGDVTIQADHILSDNFYGGGANDAISGQISGNINITVNNSYIKTFCGGPKFGSMNTNTRVKITDTATVFDHYYGGGYGGTALFLKEITGPSVYFDGENDEAYGLSWTNYTNNRLNCNNNGASITTGYDLQFFMYAGGTHRGVKVFNNYWASLSLATTDSVSSTLVDCTVNYDYYGGGCRGMVARGTHSYLEGCTIGGSAFGGGYTSAATTCDVYPTTQPTYSVFKAQYGLFTKFGTVTPETYSWQQSSSCGADQTNKILYTTQDMTQMGKITANTFITVKDTEVGGHLFGGGNSSTVGRNTTVNVFGSSYIHNNVYGGGNQADVGGDTKVTIGECE